jgi:acyl carrier protein
MDKVREIIAESFKIDGNSINLEMTPDDIELWDSLGQLLLISNLEKAFQVVFEIEEIFQIMSIGDIYTLLKKKKVIDDAA